MHERLPSRLEQRVLRERHESHALLVRENARRESQPSSPCVAVTVTARGALADEVEVEGIRRYGCGRSKNGWLSGQSELLAGETPRAEGGCIGRIDWCQTASRTESETARRSSDGRRSPAPSCAKSETAVAGDEAATSDEMSSERMSYELWRCRIGAGAFVESRRSAHPVAQRWASLSRCWPTLTSGDDWIGTSSPSSISAASSELADQALYREGRSNEGRSAAPFERVADDERISASR